MEFKKFCENRDRMCKHYSSNRNEYDCPLHVITAYCCHCESRCMEYSDKAEMIVTDWMREHPPITMFSTIKEKFPYIALGVNGVPKVCPHHLCPSWLYPENGGCVFTLGVSDCVACWNRPVPNGER